MRGTFPIALKLVLEHELVKVFLNNGARLISSGLNKGNKIYWTNYLCIYHLTIIYVPFIYPSLIICNWKKLNFLLFIIYPSVYFYLKTQAWREKRESSVTLALALWGILYKSSKIISTFSKVWGVCGYGNPRESLTEIERCHQKGTLHFISHLATCLVGRLGQAYIRRRGELVGEKEEGWNVHGIPWNVVGFEPECWHSI